MSDESQLRESAVQAIRRLDALGLNRGSTGNASLRWARDGRPGMLITPTGATPDRLQPEDLCWLDDDGSCEGPWAPSSESGLHRAAYAARPDLGAVLHTHAEHATALACLGRPLPAFHYMVAVAGGDDVPLVPYHRFGSAALADGVAAALADRQACLLAQHGLVSAGRGLAEALKVMREVESLCRIYLLALSAGSPPILDAGEMAAVVEKFRSYGQTRRTG
jgi:L-fuculose-phosphate aldolase